jgi:hypothetical protein
LLDDTTAITYSPPFQADSEWHVCDRAAEAIAVMLGWQREPMTSFINSEQREALLTHAREWAKEVH